MHDEADYEAESSHNNNNSGISSPQGSLGGSDHNAAVYNANDAARLMLSLAASASAALLNANSNDQMEAEGGSTGSMTASGAQAPKMFKCKQCMFTCMNKEDYWQHQRDLHIKPEKLLECSKFVTEYKHHLEYHMRNHLGSKPYKCPQCDYACVNLSMLRSHQKSHSKSLVYTCADCTYSTKYYHSLKTHVDKFNHAVNPANLNAAEMNGLSSPAATLPASVTITTCFSSSNNNNNNNSNKKQKFSSPSTATVSNNSMVPLINSSSKQQNSDDLNSSGGGGSNASVASSSQSASPNSYSPNSTSLSQQEQQAMLLNKLASSMLHPNQSISPSTLATMTALSSFQQQQSIFGPLAQLYMNSVSGNAAGSSDSAQIQMALAALAASSAAQQQVNNSKVDFDTNSLLPELYLQQQQQQELLLAASYLQPLLQQQHQQQLNDSSDSNQQYQTSQIRCKLCRNGSAATFASKKELRKHMRIQHGYSMPENEEPAAAKNVHNNNHQRQSANTNQNNNNNNNNLQKPVCPVTSSNNKSKFSERENEARSIEASSLHECEECQVLFRSYAKFSMHRQMHEAYRTYVVGEQQEEDSKKKLGGSDKFRCNFCHFELPNLVEYFLHIQSMHQLDGAATGNFALNFAELTKTATSNSTNKLAQFI